MDLDRTLQETAFDQGPCTLFATRLGCEVFASTNSNIVYFIFGTMQILIVLQGVYGMTGLLNLPRA